MTFEHDKVEYDIWGKSRMRNLNFYLSTRQLPDWLGQLLLQIKLFYEGNNTEIFFNKLYEIT